MATAMEMVKTAKAGVENLSPSQVQQEIARGEVLLVDVREPNETAQGVVDGALLAPRGMLEFYADSTTPYHLDGFDRDRRVVLYCAAGSRSALAAKTLQDLGYVNVAHLEGGITAWTEEGYQTNPPE